MNVNKADWIHAYVMRLLTHMNDMIDWVFWSNSKYPQVLMYTYSPFFVLSLYVLVPDPSPLSYTEKINRKMKPIQFRDHVWFSSTHFASKRSWSTSHPRDVWNWTRTDPTPLRSYIRQLWLFYGRCISFFRWVRVSSHTPPSSLPADTENSLPVLCRVYPWLLILCRFRWNCVLPGKKKQMHYKCNHGAGAAESNTTNVVQIINHKTHTIKRAL